MRYTTAVAMAALLAGCLSSEAFSDLPPACQSDLSGVKAPVIPVTPADMERLAVSLKVPSGHRLYGATVAGDTILVDNTLQGWKRDYVIQHERCHVVVGEWHLARSY
jgi:hypothetical protein